MPNEYIFVLEPKLQDATIKQFLTINVASAPSRNMFTSSGVGPTKYEIPPAVAVNAETSKEDAIQIRLTQTK